MRRIILPVAMVLVACAAPMVTYPGLRWSLKDWERGNYELCEFGRTEIRPNRGDQAQACYEFANGKYYRGTPGWFRYMGLACSYSEPLACSSIVIAAVDSPLSEPSREGTAGMPIRTDVPVLDRATREHALKVGTGACLRGPRSEHSSPGENGVSCHYAGLLHRMLFPDQTNESMGLLFRGCQTYANASACAELEKMGGRVNWTNVHAKREEQNAESDRRDELRRRSSEEDRRLTQESEAAAAARDANRQQAIDAIRQSQEAHQRQMGAIHQSVVDAQARDAQRRREDEQRRADAVERQRLDRQGQDEARAQRDRQQPAPREREDTRAQSQADERSRQQEAQRRAQEESARQREAERARETEAKRLQDQAQKEKARQAEAELARQRQEELARQDREAREAEEARKREQAAIKPADKPKPRSWGIKHTLKRGATWQEHGVTVTWSSSSGGGTCLPDKVPRSRYMSVIKFQNTGAVPVQLKMIDSALFSNATFPSVQRSYANCRPEAFIIKPGATVSAIGESGDCLEQSPYEMSINARFTEILE